MAMITFDRLQSQTKRLQNQTSRLKNNTEAVSKKHFFTKTLQNRCINDGQKRNLHICYNANTGYRCYICCCNCCNAFGKNWLKKGENKMGSKERFFKMLKKVPRVSHLWNEKESIMHVDMINREINVMSSGEAHMARFFSAVWMHNNNMHDFDIVNAASSLDNEEILLIVDWLKNPFYP